MMDNTETDTATDDAAAVSPDIAEAVSIFQLIESVLSGDAGEDTPSEIAFDLQLPEVLALIPSHYKQDANAEDNHKDTVVSLSVDDLFQQLKRGRVQISVAKLAFQIPAELVTSAALQDETTMLKLPLQRVVRALQVDSLTSRTSKDVKKLQVDNLPDPFARPPTKVRNITVNPDASPDATPPADVDAPAEPTISKESAAPPPLPTTPAPKPSVEADTSSDTPAQSQTEGAQSTTTESAPADTPSAEPTPTAEPEPEPAAESSAAETVQNESATTEDNAPSQLEPATEPTSSNETSIADEPTEEAAEETAEESTPTAPEQSDDASAQASPTPSTPAPQVVVEPGELDFNETDCLGGVNINTASADVITTLDGVSQAIADAIIAYRDENGPFTSIFDLGDVPRLGRKTFRKISGMPYSQRRIHRRHKLAKLLGIDINRGAHLPTVVEALAGQTSFTGCVISDGDGLMLAETGVSDFSAALSAVLPKMFLQVRSTMDIVELGTIDSISLGIEGRMFTSIGIREIYLTAVHQKSKLTKAQLMLITKVGEELAWLLSHRGYAGKS